MNNERNGVRQWPYEVTESKERAALAAPSRHSPSLSACAASAARSFVLASVGGDIKLSILGANKVGMCALGFLAFGLVLGSDLQAQAPANASAPLPTPVPVVAQTQETLSARTLVRLEQLTRELSETVGRVEALEGAIVAQKGDIERLTLLIDQTRATHPTADLTAKEVSEATQIAAAPTAPDAAAALFEAPAPPAISPSLMLTNAQTALQSGSYLNAESNLSQLIWVYPTSPEASEGRWLLGEARYVQASWGTAAQAYVDYLKVSPQGPRAAEALLRLAGAFRQLGDNRQRCIALAEFKRKAPRPDATLRARADSEIARATCPAA